MSDSVPEFAGQLLGAKRRLGSPSTPSGFASQVRHRGFPKEDLFPGRVVGQETGPQWE